MRMAKGFEDGEAVEVQAEAVPDRGRDVATTRGLLMLTMARAGCSTRELGMVFGCSNRHAQRELKAARSARERRRDESA